MKLKDLLSCNLKTIRAYLLKEDFQNFWGYTSATWAGKFLDQWCTQVMRSKLEPIKKVAKTNRSHKTLLLIDLAMVDLSKSKLTLAIEKASEAYGEAINALSRGMAVSRNAWMP